MIRLECELAKKFEKVIMNENRQKFTLNLFGTLNLRTKVGSPNGYWIIGLYRKWQSVIFPLDDVFLTFIVLYDIWGNCHLKLFQKFELCMINLFLNVMPFSILVRF